MILVLVASSLFAQAKRNILVEQFTSASCGPCAFYNPAFKTLIDANPEIILIKYQCDFPTVNGDPMNNQNKTDPSTRVSFYPTLQGIPYCAMDGNKYNGHIASITQANITTRKAATSPLELKVTHSLTTKNDSMVFTITAKNVSSADIATNIATLQIAILEDIIEFPYAAGSNGESIFHKVVRKMIPSAAGTNFPALPAGKDTVLNYKVVIPTYTYNWNNLSLVVFVQNKSGKEVLQAAKSPSKPLTGGYFDLSNTINTNPRKDFCSNMITAEMAIFNESTNTAIVDSIDFTPFINGSAKTNVRWRGSLAPGAKTTFNVGNFTLPNGATTFNIATSNIYSGGVKVVDLVRTNNLAKNINNLVIPAKAQSPNFKESFETNVTGQPSAKSYYATESLRMFKADSTAGRNGAGLDFPYGMGGYGKSRYNLFFGFSDDPGAGRTSSIYLDKVDLTKTSKSVLSWNHAFAVKDPSNTDELEVRISDDCGVTWKSIYKKSGTKLESTPSVDVVNSHIPGFWLPLPTEWKTETVDLSAYDGKEVLMRFIATSGGGWAMFMDDININGSTVGINEHALDADIELFPNPASHYVQMNIDARQNETVQINLFDINGKLVSNFGSHTLLQGSNTIKLNLDAVPGFYQLELKSANAIATQKLTIK